LVGKPDKKRPLGRPGSGQEDNIKIHLKKIENVKMGTEFSAHNKGQWQILAIKAIALRVP
jgi:hypothetical protein